MRAVERLSEVVFGADCIALFTQQEEFGGMMSYAVDETDLFQRAAVLVDKILRGTNPADIPIEQPSKFGHQPQNCKTDWPRYSKPVARAR